MSEENKDLIFISHAVPHDDYLAVWLASKLSLLGYNVWVDKEDLRSGSAFWNDIEITMRDMDIPVMLTPHSGHTDPLKDFGQKDKLMTILQFFS